MSARTPEEMAALVAKMRELGVTEFDGIKLGPAPAPPAKEPTQEELRDQAAARKAAREERQRDIMFAASSIKPALPPARSPK